MTTPDKEEMPTDIRTGGEFWAEKRDGRWQLQMRHRGPGSSFCVAQINHWADNSEALTTRIANACNADEPMREALLASREAIASLDKPVLGYETAGDGSAYWPVQSVLLNQIDAALSTLPVNDRHHSAWIVANGSGTKWRYWNIFGPTWTPDREKATRYARREDAEAVHAADEDAWTVEPYVSSAGFPRNSETDRQPLDDVGRLRDALRLTLGAYVTSRKLLDRSEFLVNSDPVVIEARAALKGIPKPATPKEAAMTEAQIKHMVDRFLMWKLPEHFNPDGGISFEPVGNKGMPHEYRRDPVGTNLLSAEQATAMVRHMFEGLRQPASEEEKLNVET